ncbi:polysaccharide deacetylase family protein [Candidatus Pelagibacter bacterium]|nr:polysaccharide deacetylase family protein [Candidatus Pelagibacter bacterium]
MTFGVMFHHLHNHIHKKGQGSISKNEFRNIILLLKKKYILNDADIYIKKIISKKITTQDICLTFDDSLKCQIDIALPVLRKEKIKAFFFIYSGAFKDNPDNLEIFRYFRNTKYKSIQLFYKDFFLSMKNLFSDDYFKFKKKFTSMYLRQFKFYSIEDKKFRFCRDRILNKKSYETLMFKLMKKKNFNYKMSIKKLFMNKSDIASLVKYNQVVGLHSSTHPVNLPNLPIKDQMREYKDNMLFIKRFTKSKPISMSHPFGRYNKDTLKILNKIGIKIGFLSYKKKTIKSLLEIPRVDHVEILKKLK